MLFEVKGRQPYATSKNTLWELARSALRVVLEGVMREELDALIGVGCGESSPSAKGIGMGSTSAVWEPPQGGSKTCRCREIARANSIPRCSSAMVAMNHRWLRA